MQRVLPKSLDRSDANGREVLPQLLPQAEQIPGIKARKPSIKHLVSQAFKGYSHPCPHPLNDWGLGGRFQGESPRRIELECKLSHACTAPD
jgi:hypothetical protein